MNHLKEFKKEFGILDWPGNSPDLKPIENCWEQYGEEAEGRRQHHLAPQADRGNQAHVGHRRAPQLLPEVVQFDAQEAQGSYPAEGRDNKVLTECS
jgi:hypothetical protein